MMQREVGWFRPFNHARCPKVWGILHDSPYTLEMEAGRYAARDTHVVVCVRIASSIRVG